MASKLWVHEPDSFCLFEDTEISEKRKFFTLRPPAPAQKRREISGWVQRVKWCLHHWMTIPKFWPKPIPRLFFRYQIFRNRYRDLFSDTKFSETETDTLKKMAKVSKPKPILFFRYQIFWNQNHKKFGKIWRPRPKLRLLNIFYIFYNFWTDTQLNELLPTNNGLVHIVHILRNTNFWSPETPLPLCNIVMNFDDPPYVIS